MPVPRAPADPLADLAKLESKPKGRKRTGAGEKAKKQPNGADENPKKNNVPSVPTFRR